MRQKVATATTTVSIIGGHWPPSEYSAPIRACWLWHVGTCQTCDASPVVHVGLLFEHLDALGALAVSARAADCGVTDPRRPHVFEVLSDRPPSFRALDGPPWETASRLSIAGPLQWPGVRSRRATRRDNHERRDDRDDRDNVETTTLRTSDEDRESCARTVFAACLAACARPWTFVGATYLHAGCCVRTCGYDCALTCCAPADATASSAGNCVMLLMVVLAHARAGGIVPPESNDGVLRALGVPASYPRLLAEYGPTRFVEALRRAGWLAEEGRAARKGGAGLDQEAPRAVRMRAR